LIDEQLVEKELLARARKWAEGDSDPLAAALVVEKIAQRDFAFLRENFLEELRFGTAGLRGAVGVGPGKMNLSLVSQTSWALGRALIKLQGSSPGVVVGFDARPESEEFANCAAETLAAQGVRVFLTQVPLPTPCVAFLVRYLKASAGVVVTASHNPRGDNGYKVFDNHGVQIVAPWEEEILELMACAPPPNRTPRSSIGVEVLPISCVDSYFNMGVALAEKLVHLEGRAEAAPLKIAYTPLHGVGGASLSRALSAWPGLVELHSVASQAEPDGTFPTIRFPNPEEEGVLDAVIDVANARDCEAVFAHDPDADRFSMCLRLLGGEFTRLSGDAVGLLFLNACLKAHSEEGREVFSTIVSSPGAEDLASLEGVPLHRTLTGFKWLCHAALGSERFLFAYEEALGYCFAAPPNMTTVMDKDGIVAAMVMARLLADAGSGAALMGSLFSLYERIGQWGSFSVTRRLEGVQGASKMGALLTEIRLRPPRKLGGLTVSSYQDYEVGGDERAWFLGEQNLLRFDLEADSLQGKVTKGRVLVRPSGTEAKLKLYIHLKSEFRGAECFAEVHRTQAQVSDRIAKTLFSSPL
jgi:phosphomannomutase